MAGTACADVIELFLLNSRLPHYGEGDLMAQLAAVDRGALDSPTFTRGMAVASSTVH